MEKATGIEMAPAGALEVAKEGAVKELEASSKSSEVLDGKPTETDYTEKTTKKPQFSDFLVIYFLWWYGLFTDE